MSFDRVSPAYLLSRIRSLTLVALGLLVFVACGAPASPVAASGASASWSETLPHDAKVEFMKATFSPALGPVFKAHDATRFASFGCQTCHGPDAKPQPRDFLPHLTLTADGNGIVELTTKPEVSKFMVEVEVAAAKAFGKPPYDVKTGQGFGCAGCHALDKK